MSPLKSAPADWHGARACRRKWETLVKSPDFEPVGLVENDPQRRAAAEKLPAYAGARWMTEAELLATPGLQAIAVETEVKDLLATASRCLAAGKHVHLDKPAGEDLALFRTLRESAERRKLVLQMGYMFRYHPAFQLCRSLAAGGALGKIFSIEASMSKRLPDLSPLLPYRGGSMFELGLPRHRPRRPPSGRARGCAPLPTMHLSQSRRLSR